ncbi:unnamed protein product [Protopolystoma xenopodis]|uniref:Mannosyltransferase n=1 Tax=Protopolystoma xenopodis TaxID=117903 RepID=A0A448XDP4_9PLAT|nr:unnamed protein product [Protopolystoma xenopodis]
MIIPKHKEFRFLFPLVPITCYYSGMATVSFKTRWLDIDRQASLYQKVVRQTGRLVLSSLLLVQLVLALYTSLWHQRGGLDAVLALGRRARSMAKFDNEPPSIHSSPVLTYVQAQLREMSVLFLMPCHSTPFYSHIHANITLRQLDCSPKSAILTATEPVKPNSWRASDLDEADAFFADPVAWLRAEFPLATGQVDSIHSIKLPTHLVLFSHLVEKHTDATELKRLFSDWGYHRCGDLFHTHFPTHSRHGTRVYIFCAHGWDL